MATVFVKDPGNHNEKNNKPEFNFLARQPVSKGMIGQCFHAGKICVPKLVELLEGDS